MVIGALHGAVLIMGLVWLGIMVILMVIGDTLILIHTGIHLGIVMGMDMDTGTVMDMAVIGTIISKVQLTIIADEGLHKEL